MKPESILTMASQFKRMAGTLEDVIVNQALLIQSLEGDIKTLQDQLEEKSSWIEGMQARINELENRS